MAELPRPASRIRRKSSSAASSVTRLRASSLILQETWSAAYRHATAFRCAAGADLCLSCRASWLAQKPLRSHLRCPEHCPEHPRPSRRSIAAWPLASMHSLRPCFHATWRPCTAKRAAAAAVRMACRSLRSKHRTSATILRLYPTRCGRRSGGGQGAMRHPIARHLPIR